MNQKSRCLLKRLPAVAAALLMLAMFASPVLAANTIAGSFDTPANAAPTISLITASVMHVTCVPDVGGSTNIVITCADTNGAWDLASATVTVTGYATPFISTTPSSIVDSTTAIFTVPVQLPYWLPAGGFGAHVVVKDTAGLQAVGNLEGLNYDGTLAITVDTPSIAFGTLTWSQTGTAAANIHNAANSPISTLTGTDTAWTSSTTGTPISGNTLWAKHDPSSFVYMNSGDSISATINPGTANIPLAFEQRMPSHGAGDNLAGTYSTTVTLLAAA